MCAKRKKTTGKVVALRIVCVFLAIVLAVLLLGFAYLERMLGLIERDEGLEHTLSSDELYELENQTDAWDENFTGPVIDPDDVIWSTEPAETITGEHLINILLIGQDRREGEGRQRSDAMILCTINKDTKTLTMTSFLRDLYVQIPGYQDNRLNAAYPIGGMPLLDETLKLNFGVHVDGNIEVDFSQFEQIIDLMGGVDIELTSAEASHLNANYGYGLAAGVNHLNGKQALSYSRIRYIGTDFGRTNRQRTVLAALFEQTKDLSLLQLNDLLTGVLRLITTDMSNAQIMGYAVECFPLLKDLTIQTQYIPAEGAYQYASIRGMSVIVPDLDANRDLLAQTILDS